MNILLISASDFGGAGIACLRLLRALGNTGANVRMLVLKKGSDDERVFEWADAFKGRRRKAQKIRLVVTQFLGGRRTARITRGRPPRWDAFTPPAPAILDCSHPFLEWANVVHLHWCAQFWNLGGFQEVRGKKVFWTFHDLNPVTGGCHFPADCRQFETICTYCPQLEGARNPRAVQAFFRMKQRTLERASHLPVDGDIPVAVDIKSSKKKFSFRSGYSSSRHSLCFR